MSLRPMLDGGPSISHPSVRARCATPRRGGYGKLQISGGSRPARRRGDGRLKAQSLASRHGMIVSELIDHADDVLGARGHSADANLSSGNRHR